MHVWIILWVAILAALADAEPFALRVVAANLTSDPRQSYSPDNGLKMMQHMAVVRNSRLP